LHSRGHRVVAIVSAMGKTTDELVKMAYQVSPHPNRRELDMLLALPKSSGRRSKRPRLKRQKTAELNLWRMPRTPAAISGASTAGP
jgi:aspartokinase